MLSVSRSTRLKENVNANHVSPGSLGIEHKTEGSRRVAPLANGFQGYSKTRGRRACGQEGMFPYETHYVLATDEEVERLVSLHSVAGVNAKKADGRIRLVPARTTLHAQVA